jgi:TPR repeat protein
MSAGEPSPASTDTFQDEMRAWQLTQERDFDGAARIVAALVARHSTWALLNQRWVEESRAAQAIDAKDYERAAALLIPLAASGSGWALSQQIWLDELRAWREIKARKYSAVGPLLHSLAERGSAWAMVHLGRLYRDRKLGRRDLDKAIALLEKAASLGEVDAYLSLGRALVCKGDFERARSAFVTGAELGHERCMLQAGMALFCLSENEADTNAGLAWLYRAARKERMVAHNAKSLFGCLRLYAEVAWLTFVAIPAARKKLRAD